MFNRRDTSPPASSVTWMSRLIWRVSLAKPAMIATLSPGPSSRSMDRSVSSVPSARLTRPSIASRAAAPATGSPSDTSVTAILAISMETGSSGILNGCASGAGKSVSSVGTGRRSISILSVVNSLTENRPRTRATRFQSSTAPVIRSQTPFSSDTSICLIMAREDKAPSSPVTRIVRLSLDRVRSSSRTSGPPASSSS